MDLETLNSRKEDLLEEVKFLKTDLEDQKKSLDGEKSDLEATVKMQALQIQESQSNKATQEYYLGLTETEYQQILSQKEQVEKKAAEIRARIFELVGVSSTPTFGEAYEIAVQIEKITGVRPALLLAVITQESNLGKNVGQCYLKNTTTGSGVTVSGVSVSNVMKPSRDVQPFLQITKSLGRDPFNTPVSCQMPSVGGYGGAMGPAQFIPSTWVLYEDRLEEIIGSAADPWDIRDSFLAAALYLADAGATKQTYEYEWCAALTYFTGSCSLNNQVRYEFYGDSVMSRASAYADDIAKLEKN
jgi:membrane-bound lytic murein transglycosylase B